MEGDSATQQVLTNRHFVHNTTNNTSITHKLKKHRQSPPADMSSRNFKLIGECDRSTSHGGARSLQHSDAIFQSEINPFFIL